MPVLTCEFRLGTPALSPVFLPFSLASLMLTLVSCSDLLCYLLQILHPTATFRGAFPSPGVHTLRSAAPVWRWHALQVLHRAPGEHLVLVSERVEGDALRMGHGASGMSYSVF